MKKTLKAFTLVELIVVITILAILGTIAFISLSGYNNDARNTKVTSDLRNLASAIEVSRTRESITLSSLATNTSTNNIVASSNVVYNGSTTLGTAGVNYLVGNIDFSKIEQNGESFKDPNSFDKAQEYIYGTANNEDFTYYQLAGQIIENDITKTRVIGTYTQVDTINDVVGIISSQANDDPIENDTAITGDLYQ